MELRKGRWISPGVGGGRGRDTSGMSFEQRYGSLSRFIYCHGLRHVRTYVSFAHFVHSPSSLLSCNEPLVSYLRLPHRSSCRAFLPCPPCPIPTAAGHCIALNIIVKVLPRVGIRHRSDDLRYCIVAELYTELCISPPSFRLLIRSASLG